MKILVTGGAGFIGSHLCEKLLELDHEVTCLDNFNKFYDPNIKRDNIRKCKSIDAFTLIEGDLLDLPRVRNLLSAEKFDVVVHLAAIPGVRPSVKDPFPYEENNIRGTLNMLQTCKESGANKFIFASSSSVYGIGLKAPFKETLAVGRPASPYAATKLAGEVMCHAFHHVHGINMAILRYFTVYGPRQRPEMAIHEFTRKALDGEVIKKFGDGSSVRDYTYIDDVIDVTVKSIEKCQGYEIYNIGSSAGITLNDLLKLIGDTVGVELNVEQAEEVAGDVPLTLADVTRAKLKLGYKPSVAIDEGIRRFVEWLKTRREADARESSGEADSEP
ncbi:MAG: NAD-dependent epimerase/dehydratase family protein [Pseudomonadota bacterium]